MISRQWLHLTHSPSPDLGRFSRSSSTAFLSFCSHATFGSPSTRPTHRGADAPKRSGRPHGTTSPGGGQARGGGVNTQGSSACRPENLRLRHRLDDHREPTPHPLGVWCIAVNRPPVM